MSTRGFKGGCLLLEIWKKKDSYPALKLMWRNWQKIERFLIKFKFKIGGKNNILKILVRN